MKLAPSSREMTELLYEELNSKLSLVSDDYIPNPTAYPENIAVKVWHLITKNDQQALFLCNLKCKFYVEFYRMYPSSDAMGYKFEEKFLNSNVLQPLSTPSKIGKQGTGVTFERADYEASMFFFVHTLFHGNDRIEVIGGGSFQHSFAVSV